MKEHIKEAAQEQAKALRRTAFAMKLVVLVFLAIAAACAYGLFIAIKADAGRTMQKAKQE